MCLGSTGPVPPCGRAPVQPVVTLCRCPPEPGVVPSRAAHLPVSPPPPPLPQRADRHTGGAGDGHEMHRLRRGTLPTLLDTDFRTVAVRSLDGDRAVRAATADGLRGAEHTSPLPDIAVQAPRRVEVAAEGSEAVLEF